MKAKGPLIKSRLGYCRTAPSDLHVLPFIPLLIVDEEFKLYRAGLGISRPLPLVGAGVFHLDALIPIKAGPLPPNEQLIAPPYVNMRYDFGCSLCFSC